jgi:hypothetical protein
MASDSMTDARKVGDSFYKQNFGRGIKSRANLILKISVLLIIIELIDEVPIILDVFQEDSSLIIFSVVEILVPMILMIIIYMLVRELKRWDDTYRKVRKMIG